MEQPTLPLTDFFDKLEAEHKERVDPFEDETPIEAVCNLEEIEYCESCT